VACYRRSLLFSRRTTSVALMSSIHFFFYSRFGQPNSLLAAFHVSFTFECVRPSSVEPAIQRCDELTWRPTTKLGLIPAVPQPPILLRRNLTLTCGLPHHGNITNVQRPLPTSATFCPKPFQLALLFPWLTFL